MKTLNLRVQPGCNRVKARAKGGLAQPVDRGVPKIHVHMHNM